MLTDEQKAKRREGIGASDSAIIMGYSTYKTPYELYLEKTGFLTYTDETTEPQYWGNMLEPLIIKRFSEENEVEVTFPDTIHHPDYPFIFANLDGWIPSLNSVVEAKCVNSFQRKLWDVALTDGIPLTYLIQIAKQCALTNADKGYCAVLIGGMEYKQFVYERDLTLEDLIIKSDIEFWNCVQNREPPAPINTSDCKLQFKSSESDKAKLSTFKTSQIVDLLLDTKSKIKELEAEEDFYKMQLMSHMKESEYLVGQNGDILATWKANKKGVRMFNLK